MLPFVRYEGIVEKIVVVEGIDRVGKTTFAEKLVKRANENGKMLLIYKHPELIVKYGEMDTSNETDKMFQMLQLTEMFGGEVVFDRFHISEFVYGVVERKYKLSEARENMIKIDNLLSGLNSFLVYVKPLDIVWSSNEHGKNLKRYCNMMNAAYKESNMRKVDIDFSLISDDDKSNKLIDDIIAKLG